MHECPIGLLILKVYGLKTKTWIFIHMFQRNKCIKRKVNLHRPQALARWQPQRSSQQGVFEKVLLERNTQLRGWDWSPPKEPQGSPSTCCKIVYLPMPRNRRQSQWCSRPKVPRWKRNWRISGIWPKWDSRWYSGCWRPEQPSSNRSSSLWKVSKKMRSMGKRIVDRWSTKIYYTSHPIETDATYRKTCVQSSSLFQSHPQGE